MSSFKTWSDSYFKLVYLTSVAGLKCNGVDVVPMTFQGPKVFFRVRAHLGPDQADVVIGTT